MTARKKNKGSTAEVVGAAFDRVERVRDDAIAFAKETVDALNALRARYAIIVQALGLDASASDKQIVDRLVELSDYGLAGKQLIEALARELSLALPTKAEDILVAVKDRAQSAQMWSGWCATVQQIHAALGTEPGSGTAEVLEKIERLQTYAESATKSREVPSDDADAPSDSMAQQELHSLRRKYAALVEENATLSCGLDAIRGVLRLLDRKAD